MLLVAFVPFSTTFNAVVKEENKQRPVRYFVINWFTLHFYWAVKAFTRFMGADFKGSVHPKVRKRMVSAAVPCRRRRENTPFTPPPTTQTVSVAGWNFKLAFKPFYVNALKMKAVETLVLLNYRQL